MYDFSIFAQPRSQAPNGLLAISTVDRFGPWYGFPIRGNICNHYGFLIYAAGCDYHGDNHFPQLKPNETHQPDNMSRDFTKAFSVMRVARNSK